MPWGRESHIKTTVVRAVWFLLGCSPFKRSTAGAFAVLVRVLSQNNMTEDNVLFENGPRSIYQYSNMAPRLSGQTSIFGVVFFVSRPLLGTE